jgi:hypothetical protein
MSNSNKVEIKMIAPLMWFYYRSKNVSTVTPFELGHGFYIEKINKRTEVEPFLKEAHTLSKYDKGNIMGFSRYAIIKLYTVSNIEASNLLGTKPYNSVEEIKSLIKMAFGIAKATNMSFPTFHIRQNDAKALVSTSYDIRPSRWKYDGVELTDEDLLTVKLLIKKIEPLSGDSHNRIMNACTYFESGRLSNEYIVRFVMLVSVLESLFNSSTDHISETIALRCSSILTDNKNQRFDYYRRLKDVYNMRSHLVHGQKIPKKFNNDAAEWDLIKDAEFFARFSLLHIFQSDTEEIYKLSNKDFNEHFAKTLL